MSAPPLAGAPPADVAVPAAVRRLAGDRALRPVWLNGQGGLTFEVLGEPSSFVKFVPANSGGSLATEAAKLAWANPHAPSPRVLAFGHDETGEWLETAAMAGLNAVDERWRQDLAPVIAAVGRGLRALHDALPVADCPYSWMAEARREAVRHRAAAGLIIPADWRPELRHLSLDEALAIIEDIPPIDRLVVCHGDACAPNTLIGATGGWVGHVDFGALGLADRWADVAICAWSLDWNFGPGWDAAFYAAYGVDPDPDRIAYYRLLWALEG
ncbi:aminoglycoside 3'-phosphotransferase [Phenylobacterium immobile]|uniref:aminoglycoside 3'-phosphotransferase n=1 Tax=Phenylobacterium immobile TaxID=21 RepID=UPI000A74387F|nr:aminoglycoside 3'-phosphotransferase [Phenylobacterium immobile]